MIDEDPAISRLHASVDIRDGRIVARDIQSAIGTYSRGTKLKGDVWHDLGPIGEHQELRLGDWSIGLTVREGGAVPVLQEGVRPAPVGAADPTVVPLVSPSAAPSNFAPRASLHAPFPNASAPPPVPYVTSALPPLPYVAPAPIPQPQIPRRADDLMAEAERVHALLSELRERMPRLRAALVAEVEALPLKRRAHLAERLWVRFPELLDDPEIAAVVARTGFQRGTSRDTGDGPGGAALAAIRDLSRALGDDEPPRTAREVEAFAAKLKSGLTEMLAGYMPLLVAVARFEQEVAVRTRATSTLAYPTGPEALGRLLFDWRDASDKGVRFLRSSFADLLANQMGTLQGVMHGVRSLLDELSPAAILATWEKRERRGRIARRLFAVLRRPWTLWRLFSERHADLADEEHERFHIIFGPEFAEEYRGFRRALRQQANPLPQREAPGTQVLPPVDAPKVTRHTERLP